MGTTPIHIMSLSTAFVLLLLLSNNAVAFDSGLATNLQAIKTLAPYLVPPDPLPPSERLLQGKDQQQGLDKYSTASDVVRRLRSRQSMAPFVGPHGVAVVTGGSSGIGRKAVETLASASADMRVVLCARDTNAARQTLNEIRQTNPHVRLSNIRIQALDLADLNSVESAANEIIATEGKIDVICNNAGLISVGGTTAQNFEIHMGINHIGHFHLTRMLLPIMNKGGRVVTVASSAHASGKRFNVDDLNFTQRASRYSPWTGYVWSKLANILFAKALQDKVNDAGREDILSLSLHPGIVRTNLWRHSDHLLVQSVRDTLMCSKSIDQGAATEVFCCIANAGHFRGGDYVVDCQISSPNINGIEEDKNLRAKIWQKTEELIRNAGFDLPEELF